MAVLTGTLKGLTLITDQGVCYELDPSAENIKKVLLLNKRRVHVYGTITVEKIRVGNEEIQIAFLTPKHIKPVF